MRLLTCVCVFFIVISFSAAQEQESVYRGSIPEELLRPRRGEIPHLPVDTVIGEMGQGKASDAAFKFANFTASRLLAGDVENPAFSSISKDMMENYLSALAIIEPRSFRIGGGKEEPDGAVSFLVRFIGKEQGITGELFIRFVTKQKEQPVKITEVNTDDEVKIENTNLEDIKTEVTVPAEGKWIFEELILEEAKNHGVEIRDSIQRFDFSPYERFF
jgi:hypothetical protein